MAQVITWQTPSGRTLNACKPCETKLTVADEWPRDARGEEYCQVHEGRHSGVCDVCSVGRTYDEEGE